ncbi:MAG: exosome complex RNA-binding protein Rrp4 [Thermoplasmata archaeon]
MSEDSNEIKEKRVLVLPGELVGDKSMKIGNGAYYVGNDIYSYYMGIKSIKNNYVNVIPLKSKYFPNVGDIVIGTISEVANSNWMVDINSIYPAFLHVNDVPWKIGKKELTEFLKIGDLVLAEVSHVDETKHITISMTKMGKVEKKKIESGITITIPASKVPRVIGKSGSMISMIKEYLNCRIIVGNNGVIWIDGKNGDEISEAIHIIEIINSQAQKNGLTDTIKNILNNWKEQKMVKKNE